MLEITKKSYCLPHENSREACSQVDIPEGYRTVLALPPILQASNTLEAAWAFMLVQKVLKDILFLLPDAGPDVDRVVRFFLDTGHADSLVLLPERRASARSLFSAVDLLVFVPRLGIGAGEMRSVLEVETPIMLSDVPAQRAAYADRANCFWCAPNDPKDAARVMLNMMEGGE